VAVVPPQSPAQQRQIVLNERGAMASPSAPNLLKPQLYVEALREMSPAQAGKRLTAGLVIPDYAARMAVIDLEEFPAGEEERLSLLRFRLRKTVPFHIDEAQLSYSIQVNEPKQIEVLTVSIARPILDEYEALIKDAGYRVGLVTPSSVAALPLCATDEPGLTVVAKTAGSTLSVMLLDKTRVRLVRCLDLALRAEESAISEERAVMPLLQQTLAYAEDHVGQPVTRLLLCGFGTDTEFLGRQAQRELKINYAPLRSKFGAPSQANAGLLGLLEQYAA
jgi:type IV pilus assembly protein PilM